MSNTNLGYLRIVTVIFLLTSFGLGPINLNAAGLNLIKNPSFETAGTNGNPADWTREYWGSPTPTFKYPDTGRDGVGKSASITYAQSTSGGAFWGHSVVAVQAGESYTYSNWFKSDVATEIDAEFTSTTGRLSYALVTILPSTGGVWRQTTSTIKIPTGITKLTVFHLIEAKGTLAVDDFSLVKVGATSTPPTSTTTPPTATTTPPTSTTTAPTLTLTATPASIQNGATSTLTWSSTNTTSCNSVNAWTTSHAVSGSQGVAPTATRIYAMSCLGGGTSVAKQVTVTVTGTSTPPTSTTTPPTSTTTTPTLTLTATPASIQKGATSTLTWTALNATSCNSVNAWTTSHAVSGSQGVAPTATRIYAMSCLGGGTSVSKQVTVTVTGTTTPPTPPPAPTLTLTANPINVKLGTTSTLSWVSTNTTACSALNGWSASNATSSSQIVTPVATTTYEMSCFGAGGTTTKQATISVTLPPPPPTLTLSASPANIILGATSTLSWSSTNTTSCSALNTWTVSTSTTGVQIVSPSATTTYEMSCFGAGGTTTQPATVSVTIPPPPPPPSNPELFDKGIVTFTFDDGLKSAFEHMNLLGNFKSTQYIYTEPMFGATLCNGACYQEFMSIADVKSLYNTGHEIASHTRSHPDLTTVSAITKLYEIDGSRLDLLTQIGMAATNLAYPYGALDNVTIDKLKSAGYGGARSVFPDELNTKLTNRYSLFARQVNSDVTVATVRGWIDEAVTTKKWLILVLHEVRTDCTGELYCATPSTVTGIVNYLSSVGNNVNVLTVGQGLELMNNNPVSKPGIPVITQSNITTGATSGAGASVAFSPQISDDDLSLPAPLNAFCTIPNSVEDPFSGLTFPTVVTSGYTFPIGTTPVTCTAADAGGRVGTKTFNVVVN